MRAILLGLALATFASAANAQVYPGWRIVPVVGDPGAIETSLRCIDGECAADTLQCVYFRRTVEKMGDGARTESLVGQNFTWGQFEYWLARRFMDERSDQPIGLDTISNSRRAEQPALKQAMGKTYVSVAYATTVGGQEAALPVALWISEREVRGLRCSYRVTENDDPRAKIAQLLELVITQ
ncbi:hypothetical protein GJW-30_1_01167 [Variibacter gotjawalensis]|uniref:Uncharacterized protein n=1 Tax=Variibacter gotjawalensis TaxID=1333996 RepID=A0A0S3PS18_9BRAD|nr:hypothetical protein [Variibacter gotjawalensis]NIK48950.1 hypothetical protein [Variibacter gotjawalensis]RZS50806.1 hypothetical protein EV661_3277 [Variibacter gotjawalensis]BAT58640.1 hypothetical protein GJW-30_1_01167 [Variibacter gotjawalensis]